MSAGTGRHADQEQNVFDDFYAAGKYLVDQKYTSHAKLALMGGSNGGLLMGAMITQHPDLARAIVSAVGIYDMVRVELDPNGSFDTTEFGTVKNPDEFKALYAYSPYHHVVAKTAYPRRSLMTTGAPTAASIPCIRASSPRRCRRRQHQAIRSCCAPI